MHVADTPAMAKLSLGTVILGIIHLGCSKTTDADKTPMGETTTVVDLAALTSASAMTSAEKAEPAPPAFETTDALLATFPAEFDKCNAGLMVNHRTHLSDSTRTLAYKTCAKGKEAMVIAGQAGPPHDQVQGPYFVGEDVVYYAREGKDWFHVFNHTVGNKADRPPATVCRAESDPMRLYCRFEMLGLGSDSWANFTTNEKRQRVVAHSVAQTKGAPRTLQSLEGEPFDSVGAAAQDRAGTLIYAARTGKKWVVVGGSKKSEEFDEIGTASADGWAAIDFCASAESCFEPGSRDVATKTFAFSEDGARIAFPARRGKDWFVAGWDAPQHRFDAVGNPLFSRKHEAFVHWARLGKSEFVVVGSEQRGPFSAVSGLSLAKESGEILYTEKQGKEHFAVAGSHRSGPYADVKFLRLGPTGSPVFAQSDGKKWRMVRGGETDAPFDDVKAPQIKGNTVVYFGETKAKGDETVPTLVVNGRALEIEPTRELRLDEDGTLSYVVRADGKLRVDRWANGVVTPGTPLEFEDIRKLVTGPAGRIAFVGRTGKVWNVALGTDGKTRGPAFDEIWPLGFTPEGTFVYTGVIGKELWRKTLGD